METFIEIIKQIGVAVATIFLACPIFILFFIEYIERGIKRNKITKMKSKKFKKNVKKDNNELMKFDKNV